METRVIRIEDVSVTYPGGSTALAPTTMEFRRGEIAVLLGASGAGKSTLLRCLNLLVRPTSGRVVAEKIGPLDTTRRVRQHRGRTAMIFQGHQLISRHTALQNALTGRLAFHSLWRSLWPLPEADARIALECLDRVGMSDKALVRADRLSGGEQQRVGIARALAQQPSVILADEPVASLDPANAERFLGLLSRVCREDGITAVVSLHQLEFAKRFADRIIGLASGCVVFDGRPQAVSEAILKRIYAGVRGPIPAAAEPEILPTAMMESYR
jgi:phosphonate transport system ATP-binding protein